MKLDTLVELQDQYSDVYPLSPTGARGWVRAYREMPDIDPEVYIEWDKTHWRYHGEKDGWTYAHHFRPVTDTLDDLKIEDPDPTHTPKPEEAPRAKVKDSITMEEVLEAARRQVESERCPGCGEIHNPIEDEFINTLMVAQDRAVASEGYLIVTVTPRVEGSLTVYQPEVAYRTLTTQAAKAIESQVAFIAAQLYEEFASDRIQRGKS